jgi:hypothetical protein
MIIRNASIILNEHPYKISNIDEVMERIDGIRLGNRLSIKWLGDIYVMGISRQPFYDAIKDYHGSDIVIYCTRRD